MRVRVRFFARARDLAGAESATCELPPGATIAELRQHLAASYPRLASLLERSALAVADEFTANDHILTPGVEVALLPPVSGG
jgi:molybdopterin converting factor subunit 1